MNVADCRQDQSIGYEALKTHIKRSSQQSRSGEIRTRSGCINCRPERLGIVQYHRTHVTYL